MHYIACLATDAKPAKALNVKVNFGFVDLFFNFVIIHYFF